MRRYILSIDPGNKESAYCLIDTQTMKPIEFGKFCNNNVKVETRRLFQKYYPEVTVAIEMIMHYGKGMPAGKEIFDTCVWIGRFYETLGGEGWCYFVYRIEEKMNLCNSAKAKDSNIIQALKDRFGDKGTKKNPGWFYGFKKDIWQAYAVGVTYHDKYIA